MKEKWGEYEIDVETKENKVICNCTGNGIEFDQYEYENASVETAINDYKKYLSDKIGNLLESYMRYH